MPTEMCCNRCVARVCGHERTQNQLSAKRSPIRDIWDWVLIFCFQVHTHAEVDPEVMGDR